jgi:hypothetical protein
MSKLFHGWRRKTAVLALATVLGITGASVSFFGHHEVVTLVTGRYSQEHLARTVSPVDDPLNITTLGQPDPEFGPTERVRIGQTFLNADGLFEVELSPEGFLQDGEVQTVSYQFVDSAPDEAGRIGIDMVPVSRVVAAAAISIVDEESNPAEAAAIANIKILGGTVVKSNSPNHLATLFFPPSDGADPRFSDQHLAFLTSLTSLTRLSLTNTATTDDGLKQLLGMDNLETLLLQDTATTDAGVKAFTGLANLEVVNLQGTTITDAGVRALSDLANLTVLNIAETAITDQCLKVIGQFSQLTNLSLSDTQITDAGLSKLTGLTHLTDLYLSNTNISDAGIKELAALTNLRTLNLSGTNITDAGLRELSGLKDLGWASLEGTRTTDAGIKQLKRSLPKLQIDR